jgi:hypothetical protein
MSGLLHRLAARALGIASTVRPVAGAPTFPAQAEAPAPRVAGDLDQAEPRAAVEQPVLASRPASPAFAPDAVAEHAAPTVERLPPASDTATAPPARRAELHGQHRPVGEVPEVSSLGPAPPIERASEPDPLLAPRAVRRDTRRTGLPDPAPTPDAPPLLPLQSRSEALQVVPLPGAPSRSAARAPLGDETTEVHVSIGRIEVTAVHEAPQPKRAPARPRKPRSLDEYLAGRQERRS